MNLFNLFKQPEVKPEYDFIIRVTEKNSGQRVIKELTKLSQFFEPLFSTIPDQRSFDLKTKSYSDISAEYKIEIKTGDWGFPEIFTSRITNITEPLSLHNLFNSCTYSDNKVYCTINDNNTNQIVTFNSIEFDLEATTLSATYGGKGSAMRPTNHQQFSDNYDRIFSQPEPVRERPKLSDNAPDFCKVCD